MEVILTLLAILVLILLNAVFAGSETALVAANEHRVANDAKQGSKRATKTLDFINNPTNFLSTIQVAITMIGFVNGFLAAQTFTLPILELINQTDSVLWSTIIRVIITLILTYMQVVFGELVPKKLAMKNPEKFIYVFVPTLSLIKVMMTPLVWLLTKSSNAFGALLGASGEKQQLSEEEIRMVLVANQSAIAPREREIIENVLDFDDQLTNDVMTHRTEIASINVNETLDDVIAFLAREQYSRIPIYDEDIDDIVGVLHAKELLPFINNPNKEFSLKKLMHDVYFVPDSKRTSELFREMQKSKVYMAIVIDEFGGTAGLITIEDLLEEIVGNIFDEYDDVEVEVVQLSDGVYQIDGLASIDDVDAIINANLPIDDFDTLGGFILGELGRFPAENEKIEFIYKDFKYEVLKYEDKVIKLVKATKIIKDEGENDL